LEYPRRKIMYTPLSESAGRERLQIDAGAATVGRPKGVDGKKMSPRRTKMTSKEVENIKTKGLKAGGPGSGRRSGGGPGAKPGTPNPPATSGSKVLKQHGFKYDNKLGAHTKVVGGTVHLISYGGGDSFEHYKGRVSRGEGATEFHGDGKTSELHSYLTKNKI
jgi:hypothetical protein